MRQRRAERDLKAKISCILFLFWILAVSAVSIPYFKENYERYRVENSCVPDVVSTRNVSGYCRIIVVANRRKIDSRDLFEKEVICLYKENGFQSVKFSEDICTRPERIEVLVYLRKGDIGKQEPEFRFSFIP